jgi:hypothetical protein
MLRFLKSFFGKFRTHETQTEAPRTVETPVESGPAKCGCGRSLTGFCVGLHKLTAEEWAAHPDNPVKPVVESTPVKAETIKKAPAVKRAPAVKKQPAAKKPAAIKAAPKPRANKAAK